MPVLINRVRLDDRKGEKVWDRISAKANTIRHDSECLTRYNQDPGSPQETSQNSSCSGIPERRNDEYMKPANGRGIFTFNKENFDLSIGSAGNREVNRVSISPAECKTSTYPYMQKKNLDSSIDPNRYNNIELRRQELLRSIYIDIPFGYNRNMSSQIVTPYSVGDHDEQNIYYIGSFDSPSEYDDYSYNIDDVTATCLHKEEKESFKPHQMPKLINNYMQTFPEHSQNMYQSDFQLSTENNVISMIHCNNNREINTLESHLDSEYYKQNLRYSSEYPWPHSSSSSKNFTFDEVGNLYSKANDKRMISKVDEPAQPNMNSNTIIEEIAHTPEGSNTEEKDSQISKINTKDSSRRVKWRPVIISELKETSSSLVPLHELPESDCTHRPRPLSKHLLDKYWRRSKDNTFFICMYKNCRQKLTRRYNMRSHVRIHLNDRHFPCHVCPKSFVRRNDLNRHIRLHLSSSDSNAAAYTSIKGPAGSVGPCSKCSIYKTSFQIWHSS